MKGITFGATLCSYYTYVVKGGNPSYCCYCILYPALIDSPPSCRKTRREFDTCWTQMQVQDFEKKRKETLPMCPSQTTI